MKTYLNAKLESDEYLLKVWDCSWCEHPKGFLTKLNQDGSIPVNFLKWAKDEPYSVVKEDFTTGWKIIDFRTGESRDWAELLHPNGYTVEIYLNKFLEIIENNTIINGEIQGSFKWTYGELIKQ